MSTPRADTFVATAFCSTADKHRFHTALVRFVESGFEQRLFTMTLYRRLSQTFGHIAHYDRGGFWDFWFAGPVSHVSWVEHVLRWPCYGDPTHSYSDVERSFLRWLDAGGWREKLRAAAEADARAVDLSELARLQDKYGCGS